MRRGTVLDSVPLCVRTFQPWRASARKGLFLRLNRNFDTRCVWIFVLLDHYR